MEDLDERLLFIPDNHVPDKKPVEDIGRIQPRRFALLNEAKRFGLFFCHRRTFFNAFSQNLGQKQ